MPSKRDEIHGARLSRKALNRAPHAQDFRPFLTTQKSLLQVITNFLVVSIHHILYLRQLYPKISFVQARAYNYPVWQNRHPDVCKWIAEAAEAVQDLMIKNRVKVISLCIFETNANEVLEEWKFDFRHLPNCRKEEWNEPLNKVQEEHLVKWIGTVDIEAQFQANFSRLDTVSGQMKPLPQGDDVPECSFTITVTTKDESAPISYTDEKERRWIVAEPDPFGDDPFSDIDEEDLPSALRHRAKERSTTGWTRPVRRMVAGPLVVSMHVEESIKKLETPTNWESVRQRAAKMSFGVGDESFPPEEVFDPMEGYRLGSRDIHRKPAGGAFTDYQIDFR